MGQCSGTVALPIISACGQECCIIPSAVLSTHTGGFSGFTFRDLSEDIPLIEKHWRSEEIKFDCIYTGYLGSTSQIAYVKSIIGTCLKEGGKVIVDPAMADNGKLYGNFGMDYVKEMRTLCAMADVVIPNITEASLLTDKPYMEKYGQDYVYSLVEALKGLGSRAVLMTGVGYADGKTGVLADGPEGRYYYEHDYLRTEIKPNGWHGTGDVYASAFAGAWAGGKSMEEAARVAADYVVECIKETLDAPEHWYGVRFERAIPWLIKALEN